MTMGCEQTGSGGNIDTETERFIAASTESESTESESTESESTESESTEPRQAETDVTAPVLTGVKNLTVEVGSTISYKAGISVTDDSGECTLEIDATGVDLNTVGIYEAIYIATDKAGNSVTQTIIVSVVEPAQVTEEEVYALADAVIAEVTNQNMSAFEKAKALWNWCHDQIRYSYNAGDRNVLSGAYDGLYHRQGDCYVYYATYEVLLTRVGIENMCVTRIGGNSNHWWNLVNLGDGWYHCDTSPRRIGHKYICFMQTDEQIAAYEEAYTKQFPDHPNYYTFEPDLYPKRAAKIIVESALP